MVRNRSVLILEHHDRWEDGIWGQRDQCWLACDESGTVLDDTAVDGPPALLVVRNTGSFYELEGVPVGQLREVEWRFVLNHHGGGFRMFEKGVGKENWTSLAEALGVTERPEFIGRIIPYSIGQRFSAEGVLGHWLRTRLAAALAKADSYRVGVLLDHFWRAVDSVSSVFEEASANESPDNLLACDRAQEKRAKALAYVLSPTLAGIARAELAEAVLVFRLVQGTAHRGVQRSQELIDSSRKRMSEARTKLEERVELWKELNPEEGQAAGQLDKTLETIRRLIEDRSPCDVRKWARHTVGLVDKIVQVVMGGEDA
jgi:hypothetical protein